jgi:hypothetical protein
VLIRLIPSSPTTSATTAITPIPAMILVASLRLPIRRFAIVVPAGPE